MGDEHTTNARRTHVESMTLARHHATKLELAATLGGGVSCSHNTQTHTHARTSTVATSPALSPDDIPTSPKSPYPSHTHTQTPALQRQIGLHHPTKLRAHGRTRTHTRKHASRRQNPQTNHSFENPGPQQRPDVTGAQLYAGAIWSLKVSAMARRAHSLGRNGCDSGARIPRNQSSSPPSLHVSMRVSTIRANDSPTR